MMSIWHYDGTSGIRHTPELMADGDQFYLRIDGAQGEAYQWADLTNMGKKGDAALYGHKRLRGWRIGLEGHVPPEIAARLPHGETYGRWIDRIGLWPATVGFVALSALGLFVAIKVPDMLAPLVPQSFEKKLGDAMVGDFGGRICNGPGGQAALDALVKRIEPDSDGLNVRVVNITMVNAVALPGGNIFVFRGLLQQAKSPDELAGVIGHEIGHVRNRDVMQALLRQMGLSILLGGANSDVGGSINALVSSTYSREAEAAADAYSIKRLKAANVSPLDTAGFFARLANEEAAINVKADEARKDDKATEKGTAKEEEDAVEAISTALGYLASHPLSKKREAQFRQSVVAGGNYTDAISPVQWRAVVDSCANDPDVEPDDGFLF